MQTELYKKTFSAFFADKKLATDMQLCLEMLSSIKRIFFIGNGGSNAICSHMMEDYGKIARFRTFSFSDAALITCYANDYGYENAIMEWLKLHLDPDDLLIAISSSGESKNIVNAALFAKEHNARIFTLTGFKPGNTLSMIGDVNIHLPISNYGIVECFHQTILHIMLDSLNG